MLCGCSDDLGDMVQSHHMPPANRCTWLLSLGYSANLGLPWFVVIDVFVLVRQTTTPGRVRDLFAASG